MRAIGGRRGRTGSAVEKNVLTVLEDVPPMLRIEHCRFEIESFSAVTGDLVIRFEASCSDCDVSAITFGPAIEAHIKSRVPEIRAVRIIAAA
jgi:Fe-S cluster biogenesis protein NfuA